MGEADNTFEEQILIQILIQGSDYNLQIFV